MGLKDDADDLEKRIEAARPGRISARARILGRLITTGQVDVLLADLDRVRGLLEASNQYRSHASLISAGLLEQHGYTLVSRRGKMYLRGPSKYPDGDPPEPGSLIPVDEPPQESIGGGGGSTGEARRQVQVARDYAAWQAAVRVRDLWDEFQRSRAELLGSILLDLWIRSKAARQSVRELLSDPAELELWSDTELRLDHPELFGRR